MKSKPERPSPTSAVAPNRVANGERSPLSIRYPARVEAARLPTPLERCTRYESELGDVQLWVKRDDYTGFEWSGNKIRKLEFSFARALADSATGVVTCGGINSNHCRATAFLAARLGLTAHLFLRSPDGRPPAEWTGNTLLDRIAGAPIQWITPDEYATRDAMMQAFADDQGSLYVIPEGASNAIGSLGFAAAAEELEEQSRSLGIEFDVVAHAMGSGGTTAGLAAGRDAIGAPWELLGFAVCDDEAYFRSKVDDIRQEMKAFGASDPSPTSPPLTILDQYQGDGYGLARPEELRFYAEVARAEGLLLDPCYTGKAFRGLVEEARAGRFDPGSKILFWHTGGGFGGFSYASEWNQALA